MTGKKPNLLIWPEKRAFSRLPEMLRKSLLRQKIEKQGEGVGVDISAKICIQVAVFAFDMAR